MKRVYVNDLVTFSNNGIATISTEFLKQDLLIENLNNEAALQGKGFRYIPFVYKLFHVIVSNIIKKHNMQSLVSRIGLISAYEFANLDSNIDFEYELIKYSISMVNPMKAPFTVCNSCAGWLAIKHKMQNLNLTVSSGRASIISAIKVANHYIKSGAIDHCIILSANLNHGCYKIIDNPDSFMKSEFASAILLGHSHDLGNLCEIESVSVNTIIDSNNVEVYMQSIICNNPKSNVVLDNERSNNGIDTNFSNRNQCSFLPLYLQNSMKNNCETIYVVYDKTGSIGCLSLKK